MSEPVVNSVLSWHVEININCAKPLLYETNSLFYFIIFLRDWVWEDTLVMTWKTNNVLGNTKCWRFFSSQPLSSSCCLTTGLLSHCCGFLIKQQMIPEFIGKWILCSCRPGQDCMLSRVLHIWLLPCAALRLGASVESPDSSWHPGERWWMDAGTQQGSPPARWVCLLWY